jgi:O-antigen ligase
MSGIATPSRTLVEPRRDWIGVLVSGASVLAAGVLLGLQFVAPNKRVLSVMAALVVFGLAWRVSLVTGIGVLVLTLPFPRSTVFGSTNLAFILILLVNWLLRISQGTALTPRRTPVDAAIACLVLCYIISFRNVASRYLQPSLENSYLFLACVLMFYVIANNVRRTEDLRRLHVFQCFSMLTVVLITIWELYHPGHVFIPGWIEFGSTKGWEEPQGIMLHDTRVGGPFFDYELMCEYCAISLLLLIFLLAQARSATHKFLLAGLAVLTTFLMFATLTRGGFVALGLGLAYLLWHIRRRVSFVPIAILFGAAFAFFLAMNFYVANYTTSGDLISRFASSKFVGVIPESRATTWPLAWQRVMLHPIIGHGPFYVFQIGTTFYLWPHDLYLYVANIVGLVGLTVFLWLLGVLWYISRPQTDRLDDPSYARGFLMVGHVQLLIFFVDELKIEYLRNPIYQFQIWVLFGSIMAAYLIARREREAAAPEPA